MALCKTRVLAWDRRGILWMLHFDPFVPTRTTLIEKKGQNMVTCLLLTEFGSSSPFRLLYPWSTEALVFTTHNDGFLATGQNSVIKLGILEVRSCMLRESPVEGWRTVSAFLCGWRPELSNSFVLCKKIYQLETFSWIKHVEHKVLEMSKHYLLMLCYITWDKKAL